ncbi:RNA methyltransferase [Granulicella aggregans]|jgi:tRNA/rRNA methyltransferase|uniref:RNA methyltransferase n=1 Tax=Granulicella aggregans TaxID=474949 RepID=UPI0021DFF812|nr:TrmH family RNA methyltransferase [Granulicella aggregans]
MLSSEHLARVAVVLVRARNPKNIGAVARAMHDFGFSDLRIVNEFVMPLEGARSAVDASSVLHAARTYATVAEAVADCVVVAGTTAVGERVLEHPLFAIHDAAPKLTGALEQDDSKVAILFGSEKTGLSNEELSHCNWLTTIPMFQHAESRHLSMNLGQAVAVCLYELVRARPLVRSPESADAASSAEQERVLGLLGEVLEAADYIRHHPARSAPADLRRLVLRMKMSRIDAPVWMGMLRQILWKLRN